MLIKIARLYALTLCAAASLVLVAPTQAQTMLPQSDRLIPIPVKAVRADIEFNGTQFVLLDGKRVQMAPGVRIYGTDNMLQLYGALKGTAKTKYLVEDATGLLLNVWILTQKEIDTPDPKPGPDTVPVPTTPPRVFQ